MSLISKSFKINAAKRQAKKLGVTDPEVEKLIIDAYLAGFDVAESMFVEHNDSVE